MNLGKLIRRRREQLHLTQDQTAARAGISKPYLSNIETGKAKNPPTDGVLRALERALQFKSSELIRLAHLVRTPVDVRQEHEMLAAELNKLRSVVKGLLAAGTVDGAGGLDLDLLAEELGTEGNVRGLSAGAVVPIINNVAAGYPQNFTDLDYPPSIAEEYIRCPDLDDEQAFAARVVGDSMEPNYHEGDIVVFSPNTPVREGNDCFVRFDADGGTAFKRFYQDDQSTIRLQPLNSAYPGQSYPREQITGLWPAVFRIERLRRG